MDDKLYNIRLSCLEIIEELKDLLVRCNCEKSFSTYHCATAVANLNMMEQMLILEMEHKKKEASEEAPN